jgi:phosphatidylserine/phosphatidylglycerophosphate/cardiolipin synthase-like enzyme
MPRCVLCVILLTACTACGQLLSAESRQPIPPIEVFFSPKGGCTDAIIKEVKAAKSSVLVQAYWFTSASIVQNDVPTFIDDKHTTAHSKAVIIDGQVVITDSFNFTDQAEEENVENLLVIRDKAIADRFTANWKAHAEHAGQYRKQ